MVVTEICLYNFRNYESLELRLNAGLNIFIGENAQGKTNLLEAVYYCATGRSHRLSNHRDLIKFGAQEGHIKAFINRSGLTDRIDVHLRRESRGIALNGLPVKNLNGLFGVLYGVIFSPEDLNLVKEGPGVRRRFMDLELCRLNPVYYSRLTRYYRALKQRNHLLKTLRHRPVDRESLAVWDYQLVENGIEIMNQRAAFVKRIDEIASSLHGRITNGREQLSIGFRPSVSPADFQMRLEKSIDRDIHMGSTTWGVHKDDLNISINGTDARTFGSQGQQRTAALSMKLSQIALIQEHRQENPVLLLDDVLSELDESRQRFLINNIESIQTIITCTGLEALAPLASKGNCFMVSNGMVGV